MRHVDTISNALHKARRQASKAANFGPEDVKSPEKLAELLRNAYARITELEAKVGPEPVEFEVNTTTNSTVRLAHNFGCPVRWYVTHIDKKLGGISPVRTEPRLGEWLNIAMFGAATPQVTSGAGSFTLGTRWRMRKRKELLGIRFFWVDSGTPRTARIKLWNDTSGAVLQSVDVAVSSTGYYEALFSTPYTADLTSVNITASLWDTSGTDIPDIPDTRFFTLIPIYMNEDVTLVHDHLFSAGDARPTLNMGASCAMLELIIGNNSSGPDLVYNSASDSNNLVLNSYVTGKLVIRVEPVQAGLVQ